MGTPRPLADVVYDKMCNHAQLRRTDGVEAGAAPSRADVAAFFKEQPNWIATCGIENFSLFLEALHDDAVERCNFAAAVPNGQMNVVIMDQPVAGQAGASLPLSAEEAALRAKAEASSRLEQLRRAIRLQVDAGQLVGTYDWLRLGNFEDDAGNNEAALAAYSKGIEVCPSEYRNVVSTCRILERLDRSDEALAIANAGVANGALHDRWQRPSHLVHGLSARGWRDDLSSWRVARVLEANFATIRGEALAWMQHGEMYKQGGVDDTEGLTKTGKWTELNIIFQGRQEPRNAVFMPLTTAIIEKEIPEAASMVRGACKVSVMVPGTRVRPHHGPSNTRMRVHLGLKVPPGCFIRAGDPEVPESTRQWQEGKCLCFDDSFRHEVWHDGDEARMVLIVDVWHPDLTHEQRIAACDGELQRQCYSARWQIAQESPGWT